MTLLICLTALLRLKHGWIIIYFVWTVIKLKLCLWVPVMKFLKPAICPWLWMALFWKSRVEWGTLELFLMLICLLILLFPSTVKTYVFHLRNIAILHPMLNSTVAEMLVNSFVVSRLDYRNALLAGAPKSTLNKLQYVQNSAVSILTGTRIGSHITPVLESLHWLPVRFRVDLKILMLTFKVLHCLAPHYLT